MADDPEEPLQADAATAPTSPDEPQTAEQPTVDPPTGEQRILEELDLLDRLGGLWPTVIPRPSRTQILALVLITLLSLGPLVAVYVIFQSDVQPVVTLVDEGPAPPGGAHVVVTATTLSANTGELRVRVLVEPALDLLTNGRPTEELALTVNDARGDSTTILPADQPIAPAEFTLGLTDGSVRQFPFDSYDSPLLVVLTADAGSDQPTQLPITLSLRSAVDGFAVQGTVTPTDPPGKAGLRLASLSADRATTTIVYVVWIMILMYGLAMSGVGLLWSVVIRRVEVPVWAFGMFVGVLFALPPLRLALPGNPPLGVLVDYVSFYWAVTIVGITLLWLVAVGIRQHRLTAAQRVHPPPEE